MIEELLKLDKKIFLFINGLHNPWLDPVMFAISDKLIWVPLYIFLLYVVLRKYRNESWVPLLAILVMIVISDQTNTAILKPFFERLRPSRDPSIAQFVHIVDNYKGGLYGFASSHASNTFALALFFFILFKKTHPWIVILFVWAVMVSYSRIYLGLHYPGDVLGGIVVGCLSALLGLKIYGWLSRFNANRKKSAVHTK
jgi:undecaprenyl-diphosphatase